VKVAIVQQLGEGEGEVADVVFMLVSRPIQLTQESDRRRKHSRASDLEWEIGILGVKLVVLSRFSAAARPMKGLFGVGMCSR